MKDWVEDFHHENGKYANICIKCECQFMGHKRRFICKECVEPKEEESQEEWKPNNDMEWYELLYDIGSKLHFLRGESGPDEPEKMQKFLEDKYEIRFKKKVLK